VPKNWIPTNEEKLLLINAVKFGRYSTQYNEFKSVDYPHPCVYDPSKEDNCSKNTKSFAQLCFGY